MDIYQGFHTIIGQSSGDILWWQMCIRAIFIFLFGFLLLRLGSVRPFGKQSPLEIVIAIIIGSNLSRAITGNARFLPTLAATAVLVLIFWLFEQIAARWHVADRLLKGKPVRLMHESAFDEAVMRRHGVSRADIEGAGRTSGKPNLAHVEDAYLERNGRISTLEKAPDTG